MKITKYLMGMGLASAMALTACTADEPANDVPGTANGEAFYATVSLSLPTTQGSRSQTTEPGDDYVNSDAGEEIGKDHENHIKSILVILATLDGNDFVLRTVNQGDASNNTTTPERPSYTVKFDNGEILNLHGQTVYPFVICNPGGELVNELTSLSAGDKTFVDKIVSLTDPHNFGGWTANNFMMTNAYINTDPVNGTGVKMPTQAEMQAYTSPSTPFNLTQKGAIKVERSVARMDFRNTRKADAARDNQYVIYTDATNRTDIVGYVTLTDMALINQARDFHAFRRVSADGLANNAVIGGIETPANYVVSPGSADPASRRFTLAAFDGADALAPETFDYTPIASVTGSGTDYAVWRYVTENAIPGADNQKKGITTGVVFKGNITFPASSPLAAMAGNGDNLYKFGTVIYGNYQALIDEIKANPNTLLAAKARLAGVYSLDADGKQVDFKAEGDAALRLAENGFTTYRADAAGNYPVYYYYWNRHNDNGNSSVMGPMEFGVVRNNVYKLAVSNISEFGHPGKPGDDPTPPGGGDDDETVDLYIKLDVQVLPWTVRVNNIEF